MTLSVTKCSLVRFRHLAQFLLEVADLVAQACCELELELFGGGVHLLAQLTDKVGEILRGSNVAVSTSSLASMSLTSLIFLMSGFGSMPCSLL